MYIDTTKAILIDDWRIISLSDEYTAPEDRVIILTGKVFGHPNFMPGTKIQTSQIIDCKGRYALTTSGSTYIVGDANDDYISWLESIGYDFDEMNPFSDK